MMSIDIQLNPEFRKGTPIVMFSLDKFYIPIANNSVYDIHPDGDKFIMISKSASESNQNLNEIRIVLNFFEELKRLAPVIKE